MVALLMQLSEGDTSSFVHLLASYERAQTELRQLSPRLDQQAAQQLRDGLTTVQELCVSYGGLLLKDLFPQVRAPASSACSCSCSMRLTVSCRAVGQDTQGPAAGSVPCAGPGPAGRAQRLPGGRLHSLRR